MPWAEKDILFRYYLKSFYNHNNAEFKYQTNCYGHSGLACMKALHLRTRNKDLSNFLHTHHLTLGKYQILRGELNLKLNAMRLSARKMENMRLSSVIDIEGQKSEGRIENISRKSLYVFKAMECYSRR